jgi:hypothetical protein
LKVVPKACVALLTLRLVVPRSLTQSKARPMTLRLEYLLGHSPYNDFLFAAVGIERFDPDADGDDLTVLSALTRLQIDPWHEAARLADLSPEIASRTLAGTLRRLSEVNWDVTDVSRTAQRLVALLPCNPQDTPEVTTVNLKGGAGSVPPAIQKPTWVQWLAWTMVLVMTLALVMQLMPTNNLEPTATSSMTVQQ